METSMNISLHRNRTHVCINTWALVEVFSLKACPGVERIQARSNNPFLSEWVPTGPIQVKFPAPSSVLGGCRAQQPGRSVLGGSLTCSAQRWYLKDLLLLWAACLGCGFMPQHSLHSLPAVCWNTFILETSVIFRVFSQEKGGANSCLQEARLLLWLVVS